MITDINEVICVLEGVVEVSSIDFSLLLMTTLKMCEEWTAVTVPVHGINLDWFLERTSIHLMYEYLLAHTDLSFFLSFLGLFKL